MVSSYSIAQWYSVEDGTGGDIRGIKFKNANTGWYIGNYAQNIYKTTNAGLNWFSLDITNIDSLQNLHGLETRGDTLFVCSDYGRLIRSTNGGINWDLINLNRRYIFEKIQLIAPNILYGILSDSISHYTLIKSIDCGINWMNVYDFGAYENNLAKFQFVNEMIGYSVGYRKLLKTTNGGNNWYTILLDSIQLNYIYFYNSNTGWLHRYTSANGTLYKTSNGGTNWILNSSLVYPTRISFIETMQGFMVGTTFDSNYRGTFWKTSNGGNNWQPINYNFKYQMYAGDMAQIDNQILYVTAQQNSSLFKTTNSGDNWIDLSRDSLFGGLKSISFLNDNIGFTGGYNGVLMQTANSGFNWSKSLSYREISLNDRIEKVQCIDNTVFVTGDRAIYKSTNSGINWVKLPDNLSNSHYTSSHFLNSNTGLIVYVNGINTHLVKTTNSGINYTEKFTTANTMNTGISFRDSNYGYISFDNIFTSINLYRTTDGGENWQGHNTRSIYSICINNDSDVYLASDNYSGILRSTNRGDNWVALNTVNANWFAINFVNDKIGFATCDASSKMYYTTNKGTTWKVKNPGSTADIYGMYFNKQGLGFAVGRGGKIYRTTNNGGTTGIIQEEYVIPSKYSLSQNYPNPFNSITRIKFNVARLSDIKIVVYDILGKEITTLVNEKLNSGTYNIIFNGDNISSGIYFYFMNANGKLIQTKKMIILK